MREDDPDGLAGSSAARPIERARPALATGDRPSWPSDWARLLTAPAAEDPLTPLWRLRDGTPSPERAHLPFLLWLLGALEPRRIVVVGHGDGVLRQALAEATGRMGLGAAITVHAMPGAEAGADVAPVRATIVETPPETVHERHRGAVDLLCVLAPSSPALERALSGRWLPAVRPGGVVLALGDAPALAGSLRPLIEMSDVDGLRAGIAGSPAAEPLERLAGSPTAQERAARLFGRLGEALLGPAPERRTVEEAWRVADAALAGLAERGRALDAARDALRVAVEGGRLAAERRDALWDAMRAAEARATEAEARAHAGESQLRRSEARLAEAERAASLRAEEADRAVQAAERALEDEREALRDERRRREDAERRRAAEVAERLDPWVGARAALLSAELAARRSPGARLVGPRLARRQPPAPWQVSAILGSDLFDPGWYTARYPDVRRRGPLRRRLDRVFGRADARRLAAHYLHHGAAEGRDPGPAFSTRLYYLEHPDVAAAGWNALVHYERFGRAEGRRASRSDGFLRDLSAEVALIEGSKLFDPKWYRSRHRDVPPGMRPAEHYLVLGAAAGRDPGPGFSTRAYEAANPDVAQAGLNPLVHFLRRGREEGRTIDAGGEARTPRQRVDALRVQLLSLGFTEAPLRELEAMAGPEETDELRMRAALELGRWHLRPENGPDPERALAWLDRAAQSARTGEMRERVVVMLLACLHRLGRVEDARRLIDGARAMGMMTPDLMLARSVIEPDEARRIAAINEAMRAHGLPDLGLGEPARGASLYDRLRTAGAPPPVADGPLVSVIVAAFNAEATLPLTLRAMAEQSWRNHEVVVVDDASIDGTRAVAEAFAARDPRVRVLPLDRNVGAYAARNRGLTVARGEFVTLQDADDWSGATRLEIQARHLMETPRAVANTTEQTRMRDDLALAHWSAQGDLTFPNFASIMFRAGPVRDRLGGWDEVRFSADNEMLRRMRIVFGRGTVSDIRSGPVTFQRYAEGSAITDSATGFNGALSGARLEYLEAQAHHRARERGVRYEAGSRPFPVPVIMRPDARRDEVRHFDVVMAADLRVKGATASRLVEEIRTQRAAGLTTGLVKLYRYDGERRAPLDALAHVRDEVDGEAVSVLVRGERARCDLLVLRDPAALQHPQRFVPEIEARRVKALVGHPPGEEGEAGAWDPSAVEANLRRAFGTGPEWHPTGPGLRERLPVAPGLAPQDWADTLDVASWDLGARPRPSGPLRIGRHAHDDPSKWPATAQAIRAAYPEADDLEVHVLGGATRPLDLLGRTPANWRVAAFGARPARDFLAELDVFVLQTDPAAPWAGRRSAREAMAAGVPAVLPPWMEAEFGDAAAYATPEGAADAARRLAAHPEAARAQTLRARTHVSERHGPASHIARLEAAGVACGRGR